MEYPKKSSCKNALVEDLLKKGYSLANIVVDWEYGGEIYDLAIVNPKIGKPVAVFDSMGYQHPGVLTAGPINELDQRMGMLADSLKIPLIIYTAEEDGRIAYFYYLRNARSDDFVMPNIESLPSYQELSSLGVSTERNVQTTMLVWICYGCAAVIFILLLVDLYFNMITDQRLILLALCVFLLIVPHAAKLNILGISYESRGSSIEKDK